LWHLPRHLPVLNGLGLDSPVSWPRRPGRFMVSNGPNQQTRTSTQSVKSGRRASQTTLSRRNGRLTSYQNNTRIAGPRAARHRPAPIKIPAHQPSTPDCSSPYASSFFSSPQRLFSDNNFEPTGELDEQLRTEYAEDVQLYPRATHAEDEENIRTKRIKVGYFIIVSF
jgi:hypothetical protein